MNDGIIRIPLPRDERMWSAEIMRRRNHMWLRHPFAASTDECHCTEMREEAE